MAPLDSAIRSLAEQGTAAVLVPVKALTGAKTRLAPLLTEGERERLAWTMLEGVLEELARLPEGISRAVVSNHRPAMERAEALGFAVIPEKTQRSESESVDAASAELERRNIRGVLRLPLDLPLFSVDALGPVFGAIADGAPAVIVPSRDGTGTNAIYRSPPSLFPSRFGSGSRRLHEAEAVRSGVAATVIEAPALALDIDEPADVAALLAAAHPCAAVRLLESWGVPARLGLSG